MDQSSAPEAVTLKRSIDAISCRISGKRKLWTVGSLTFEGLLYARKKRSLQRRITRNSQRSRRRIRRRGRRKPKKVKQGRYFKEVKVI